MSINTFTRLVFAYLWNLFFVPSVNLRMGHRGEVGIWAYRTFQCQRNSVLYGTDGILGSRKDNPLNHPLREDNIDSFHERATSRSQRTDYALLTWSSPPML